jgi:hypothetical protein
MTNGPKDVNHDEVHGLTSPVPGAPEDRQIFRLAQLTLLLSVAGELKTPVRTIDRAGIYDFLSANPFVVIEGDADRDATDRLRLRLAGFSDRQLSYASTGQRFASHRQRLQHDLSLLLAYGLIAIGSNGYTLTPDGERLAEGLTSMYADGYREAATVVLQRLGRLTDRQLSRKVADWLGRSWLLIDLLDDITETTPAAVVGRPARTRRRRARN